MPDRLVSKLHIKSWLNDFFCSEDNASRCKCASTPLYKDWLVVSSINQVDCTCALIICFLCRFDCWMTHDGRWCCQAIFGRPAVARVVQLLEDGERLLVVAWRLHLPPSVVGRLWRRYQETGEYTR